MIDDQTDDLAGARARPLVCQQREGEGIATAGHGNGEHRRVLERFEGRHQPRERGRIERSIAGPAHPQPFFWRSWSTRRFCRSVARG